MQLFYDNIMSLTHAFHRDPINSLLHRAGLEPPTTPPSLNDEYVRDSPISRLIISVPQTRRVRPDNPEAQEPRLGQLRQLLT